MLKEYSNSSEPEIVDRVCKLYCLIPREDVGNETQFALLQDVVDESSPSKSLYNWFATSVALCKLREGELDEAMKYSDCCLSGEQPPALSALAQIVRSMILCEKDDLEAARRHYAEAVGLIKPGLKSADTSSVRDWLIAEVLRREVAARISASEATTTAE